LNDLVRFEATK